MSKSSKVLDLIFEVIGEHNSGCGEEEQIEKSPETVLFGAGSALDSLGLVSLIVATEQKIDEQFEVSVTLADEKAMSLQNSPFRTVQTLADYAAGLIGERIGG